VTGRIAPEETMNLKGVVASLDEVPEALHEFYSQGSDGKYRLAADGLVDKSKVDEFRTTNIELSKRLEQFGDVDLDEYAKMREQIAEIQKQKAKDAGDWETRESQLRKEMAEVSAKERKALETELEGLRGALDEEVRIARATSALAEHKGSTKVLLPHVLRYTKTVKGEDGRYTAIVVDEQGNPRIGDSQGSNMSIAQYVETLKADPDFARNFEGTGSTGGGASKSTGGASGPVRKIAANDGDAFIANLEKVAKGEVEVVM